MNFAQVRMDLKLSVALGWTKNLLYLSIVHLKMIS
jgi:hypothetical protein